jgi:hypothetical protein
MNLNPPPFEISGMALKGDLCLCKEIPFQMNLLMAFVIMHLIVMII